MATYGAEDANATRSGEREGEVVTSEGGRHGEQRGGKTDGTREAKRRGGRRSVENESTSRQRRRRKEETIGVEQREREGLVSARLTRARYPDDSPTPSAVGVSPLYRPLTPPSSRNTLLFTTKKSFTRQLSSSTALAEVTGEWKGGAGREGRRNAHRHSHYPC